MCKSPVTESKLSSRRVSLPWGKTVHSLNGLGMADLLLASDDANLVPGMSGCMSYRERSHRGAAMQCFARHALAERPTPTMRAQFEQLVLVSSRIVWCRSHRWR